MWMARVGALGWTLIGHDSRHHLEKAELAAIKQYDIGCFYVWGAEAPRWQKMLCLLRSYERVLKAIESAPRPFIYRVEKAGHIKSVLIP